jgi:hypothetical protein
LQTQRIFLWIFTIGLCTLLMVHTGLTALYLSPENPLRSRVWDTLYGYMDPLFAQNWRLFAPNPVSQHQNLLAKARVKDRETGVIRETKWMDITRPIIQNIQTNRLASEGRVTRYMTSAIRSYVYDKGEEKKVGKWMLQRAVSTALEQRLSSGKEIEEINIRIVSNTFPRFEQRSKPDNEGIVQFRETGWMPYRTAASSAGEEWPR